MSQTTRQEDAMETETSTAASGSTLQSSDGAAATHCSDAAPSPIAYAKTKGHATTKGQDFEIAFIALVYLRLVNSATVTDFHLASNVDGAGALDDAMIKYKTAERGRAWKTCFVQLKHKEAASFGLRSCLGATGDFSASRYLASYVEISRLLRRRAGGLFEGCAVEDCTVALYTNARTFRDLSAGSGGRRSEMDEILASHREDGSVFGFDGSEEISDLLVKDKDARQVEEVGEFMAAHAVFAGQASLRRMEELVRVELSTATRLVRPDVDQLSKCYIAAIGKWWHESRTTLTKDSDILERTVRDFKVTALSSQEVKTFTFKSVQFRDEHLFDARTLDEYPLVHLSTLPSCVKLCCTKLVQSLQKLKDGYIILGLKSLLDDVDAVTSAWCRCKNKRLVIVVGESAGRQQDACNALRRHAEKHRGADDRSQKVILVSGRDDAFALNLKECLDVECREIRDCFSMSQLKARCKRRMENREVSFQGATVKLGELLKEGVDVASGVFDDDFVRRIFNTEAVTVGPVLEDTVSYYITRTLVRHDGLKEDVLRDKNSDVFVVHDITKQELQKLVPKRAKVGHVKDSSRDSCRYLVTGSGNTEDVRKALETKGNVHELRLRPDGVLGWCSTKGSIANIHNFVTTRPTSYNPNTALDLEGRVLLISAEAGMGKSTFLTHLASETKKADPSFWVIRVDLKDHLDKLHEFNGDAIQFLSLAVGMSGSVDTEHSLFCYMVEKGKCVVLCDGFDEIAPDYTDKGLALLTSLLETKASKVYITTRHALKSKLEEHLGTLTFTLRKFNANDQRKFFEKFWTKDESASNANDQLGELIEKLVDLIGHSLNDIDKEFMGTPLLTMMLAEIHEGYFKEHKTTEDLPTKLNIIAMFKQVVDKKFNIYLDKLFGNTKNIGHAKNKLLKCFFKDHMRSSLMLLLESRVDGLHNGIKIREKQDEFVNEMNTYDYKAGIITKVINGKPLFLHRTFAEYFAALWFSQNYERNRDFLRANLFSDEFRVIRRLFDLMLASQSELLTAVVNRDLRTVTSLLSEGEEDVNTTDLGGRSALHLGATFINAKCRHPMVDALLGMLSVSTRSVVQVVMEHGAVGYGKDKVLGWNALDYAIQAHSWQAFEDFHEHLSLVRVQMNECGLTQDCCYKAHKETVRLMIASVDYETSLLHRFCRVGDVGSTRALIKSLEDDLSLIARIDSQSPIGPRSSLESSTPAQPGAATVCGSDAVAKYINALDPNGQSALHYATSTFDTVEAIRTLVSKGADIWARNERGQTPLHTLCESEYCNADTIGALTAGLEGSDITKYINTTDSMGNCALHIAPYFCPSSEVIALLISKSGSVWPLNDEGESPLHTLCASKYCNKDCFNMFIANLEGKDVAEYINTKNSCGRTVLHLACENEDHEVVTILISKGGDIWAVDDDGQTALHTLCSSEVGNVKSASALITNLVGKDAARYINKKDSAGESALHLSARTGNPDVVELLIDNGGDIWALNDNGQTPLHVNCSSDYADWNVAMVLIGSCGADGMKYMNIKDAEGNTAQDLALETRRDCKSSPQAMDAMEAVFRTASDFLSNF